MAEGKKSFILYTDLITVVEKLVIKDRENKTNYAGELFLHILKYVNDKNPIPIDFIVEMAFEPIKLQLKRDLEKFVESKFDKSKSGKLGNLKRWNKDLYDNLIDGKLTLEDALNIANCRKTSQPDKVPSQNIANIAVNVTVSDNVNDINYINKDVDVLKIHDLFLKEVKEHNFDSKIESVYMRLKLRKGTLTQLIKDFQCNVIENDTKHKSTQDYFLNFRNWLNIQDKIGKLDEYKTTSKKSLGI